MALRSSCPNFRLAARPCAISASFFKCSRPRFDSFFTTSRTRPPPSRRPFSSTSCLLKARTLETERQKSRSKRGPFSATGAVVFVLAGAGLIVYFRREKARMERSRIAEQAKGVGRPKVGGPFELIDQEGHTFAEADLKGGFSLVCLALVHSWRSFVPTNIAAASPYIC